MNDETMDLENQEPEEEVTEKKSSGKAFKIIYGVLIAIFATVFVVSAFYIGSYFVDSVQQTKQYDELAQLKEQAKDELNTNTDPSATEPIIVVHPVSGAEVTILPEYAALFEKNPDMVGWIEIPGTKVNYPVLQTPYDKDYYLYRNFYREDNKHGAIFVQYTCDVDKPSDNITIYGHNMKDDTMFGELDNYLKKDYWEDHRYIVFDTLKEHHTYEIFAVFITTASLGKGFSYHAFVDAVSEEDFNNFVNTCKSLDLYDTGVEVSYGDKLICLSTCEYTRTNGRLVVVAKRIK